MDIKEIVGTKQLDAVDFSDESVKAWGEHYEYCQVCRFRLDGIVYMAVEDPDDGYRSSMKELAVDENAEMKNTFEAISVLCRHREKRGEYEDADILELVDSQTGEVVLEVGTENTDDYYPWFVAKFYPEAMCLNR